MLVNVCIFRMLTHSLAGALEHSGQAPDSRKPRETSYFTARVPGARCWLGAGEMDREWWVDGGGGYCVVGQHMNRTVGDKVCVCVCTLTRKFYPRFMRCFSVCLVYRVVFRVALRWNKHPGASVGRLRARFDTRSTLPPSIIRPQSLYPPADATKPEAAELTRARSAEAICVKTQPTLCAITLS